MRAYIFAGGYGTRLSEETNLVPKPMVSLGEKPILWHVMKSLYRQGISDFVILGGYKISVIYDYFVSYHLRQGTVVTSSTEGVVSFTKPLEDWKVTIIDTGLNTMTGGRLKRGLEEMDQSGTFLMTYGDGLSDMEIAKARRVHESQTTVATLTASKPAGRFGSLSTRGSLVTSFAEKSPDESQWVNIGYGLAEPSIANLIEGDQSVLETDVFPKLASESNLGVYKHSGFWKPIDTLNDVRIISDLIREGKTPWLGSPDD